MRERLVQLGSPTQLIAETCHGTLTHSPTGLSPVPNQVPLLEGDMDAGWAKIADVPSKESVL